jgi:molybdopterin converting factor subunit 1
MANISFIMTQSLLLKVIKNQMKVNLLLFGITKDLVGKQKLDLDIPENTTVSEFKIILQDRYPELIELNSIAIAINSEYAIDSHLIHANDEIALIPPVSGG